MNQIVVHRCAIGSGENDGTTTRRREEDLQLTATTSRSPRGEAVHVHVVVPRAVAEGEHPGRVPLHPRLEVVVGGVPHERADAGVAARSPEDVPGSVGRGERGTRSQLDSAKESVDNLDAR